MSGITFRDIEVRTWPERGDLLVFDVAGASVLAQYLLPEKDDPDGGSGDLFDPRAPYERRAELALEAVERDQYFLCRHFNSGDDAVCLRRVDEGRDRLAGLLGEHGLQIKDTDLMQLAESEAKLDALPLAGLYRLLCDWHDLIDRRYPAGSSRLDPGSWVHRAVPESCHHFHDLAGGEDEDAFRLFRELIDVPLRDFSFGMFIRYVYFFRAEFPGHPRFQLQALAQAGVRQKPAGT